MKKKFGLLHILNILMITALVLAACAQATALPIPTSAPALQTATTVPALPVTGPSPSVNQALPTYWPTQDWRTSTPEQQGMDSAQLSKVFDAIQKMGQTIHSLLIVRNGTIVTEAYYSPFRPDARTNLNATTQSVTSILIGIAIQEGFIKGLDQKMLDFFPDRKIANLDARKQAITIKDLLSMTSGLDEQDDSIFAADDGVQFALDLPMASTPGKAWNPIWSGYHLLSAIIQKATGMTTLAFANKVLFGPLGITGAGWLSDPKGINYGGDYLYLTPRDMAKIGDLYLNIGNWNGKQIVPKEYVLTSTKHQIDTDVNDWGYGYGWRVSLDGTYLSQGYYGQLISVKPAQGIVTVFTAGAVDDFSLVEEEGFVDLYIFPSVKSVGSLPENPASTALLTNKIAALEKPSPQSIKPLPKKAQVISGKKYLLEDGEAFTLTFSGDQATLDWSFNDQSMHFPIGLDNVFNTTPFDLTEQASLFGAKQRLPGRGFLALRGFWITDDIFELNMQNLNSSSRHSLSFEFVDDKVKIIHSETASSDTISFQGQVQSP